MSPSDPDRFVLLAQVEAQVVERGADMAVAEPHAQHLVVAVSVSEERFHGSDRTVGIDVLEDEQEVGVVARKRTVGGGEAHGDLPLVDELVLADLAVDAPAHGQKAGFPFGSYPNIGAVHRLRQHLRNRKRIAG